MSFKKRAPKAIKEIKAFAFKSMVRSNVLEGIWPKRRSTGIGYGLFSPGEQEADRHLQGTTDVRLDPQLNKKVWEQGVKGVPYRLRIRISRRRNDEEGAKEKLYSYVQAVNVKNPKGLPTVIVEE